MFVFGVRSEAQLYSERTGIQNSYALVYFGIMLISVGCSYVRIVMQENIASSRGVS
jgi:hypothetical protein